MAQRRFTQQTGSASELEVYESNLGYDPNSKTNVGGISQAPPGGVENSFYSGSNNSHSFKKVRSNMNLKEIDRAEKK